MLKGDKTLLIIPSVLSVFGLMMIFSASSVAALRDFNDKFYFLKHQTLWLGCGFVLLLFFSLLDYRILKKIALPVFLSSLFFLTVVLIPGLGREVYGGRRWLQLGDFNFQPAEFTKIALVIYFSSLFEKKKDLFTFLFAVGVVLALLLLEPDMGTAVVVAATALAIYFVAGASLKQILSILVIGFFSLPALIWFSPYRKARLFSFLNSSTNIEKASYHVRQILIALGSGGIFGRGLGQSRQKFLFLPEVSTDSIFAIIAEEFGFLGALVLIFIFLFLLFRGMKTALLVKDKFGQMTAVGIVFFLLFQTAVNLGAMVGVVPLTGVPLPFISYGGSSLLVNMAGMGIVYNISKSVARSKK